MSLDFSNFPEMQTATAWGRTLQKFADQLNLYLDVITLLLLVVIWLIIGWLRPVATPAPR